jgi:hypothetical protein
MSRASPSPSKKRVVLSRHFAAPSPTKRPHTAAAPPPAADERQEEQMEHAARDELVGLAAVRRLVADIVAEGRAGGTTTVPEVDGGGADLGETNDAMELAAATATDDATGSVPLLDPVTGCPEAAALLPLRRAAVGEWRVCATVSDASCLVHAFLTATCPQYRALPATSRGVVGRRVRLALAKTAGAAFAYFTAHAEEDVRAEWAAEYATPAGYARAVANLSVFLKLPSVYHFARVFGVNVAALRACCVAVSFISTTHGFAAS